MERRRPVEAEPEDVLRPAADVLRTNYVADDQWRLSARVVVVRDQRPLADLVHARGYRIGWPFLPHAASPAIISGHRSAREGDPHASGRGGPGRVTIAPSPAG